MTDTIELEVHLARDEGTGIWYVPDSEVPGLRLEAATAPDLMRAIEDVAVDLIELNRGEIVAAKAARLQDQDARDISFAIRPIIDTALAVA